jgi:hypothetical protein
MLYESSKGCPMAAAKTVEKTCPMTGKKASAQTNAEVVAKNCDKSYPMKADTYKCSATKITPKLSVLWDGNMPETATFVKVVGKMTQKDGEMLFVAESVDVMNN